MLQGREQRDRLGAMATGTCEPIRVIYRGDISAGVAAQAQGRKRARQFAHLQSQSPKPSAGLVRSSIADCFGGMGMECSACLSLHGIIGISYCARWVGLAYATPQCLLLRPV